MTQVAESICKDLLRGNGQDKQDEKGLKSFLGEGEVGHKSYLRIGIVG